MCLLNSGSWNKMSTASLAFKTALFYVTCVIEQHDLFGGVPEASWQPIHILKCFHKLTCRTTPRFLAIFVGKSVLRRRIISPNSYKRMPIKVFTFLFC